jgi:hypothetical protein
MYIKHVTETAEAFTYVLIFVYFAYRINQCIIMLVAYIRSRKKRHETNKEEKP